MNLETNLFHATIVNTEDCQADLAQSTFDIKTVPNNDFPPRQRVVNEQELLLNEEI